MILGFWGGILGFGDFGHTMILADLNVLADFDSNARLACVKLHV